MHSLVYVSSAAQLFSKEDLAALLVKSRANNEALRITGVLLYKGGNFMQVLEGEKERVLGLKNRIATDPRHRGLMVLLEQELPQRDFDKWSMGFRDLDADLASIPGYSQFLNIGLDSKEFREPARVRKLLDVFKQSM